MPDTMEYKELYTHTMCKPSTQGGLSANYKACYASLSCYLFLFPFHRFFTGLDCRGENRLFLLDHDLAVFDGGFNLFLGFIG